MSTLKMGLSWALFLCVLVGYSQSKRPYFQQRTDYVIQVTLDDTLHELHGVVEIVYTNNSRLPMDSLLFHLWPNAYKNNQTAMAKQMVENGSWSFYYAPDSMRGYIDSLDFRVEKKKANWYYHPDHQDIGIVKLPETLLPGNSITVTTPFHVKLPGDFSRLGHKGQSYQISQWYPKPAVFDRDGWHAMPYLDQGEFYSEFGSFNVSITLPKNYVVGATGDLQNKEERAWLLEKVSATEAIDSFPRIWRIPPSEKEYKTITYTQNKVHDFAWFADKRYHVLKGEVALPHGGDTVETWVMFHNQEARFWKDAIPYMNNSISAYSKWNGDYPYKQATAVFGALSAGGGMEYPNVTVIGETGDAGSLEMVIAHEVGHNWFQGILGFNERKEPAMDEGINSFNEIRYIEEYRPDFSMVDGIIPDAIAKWLNLDGYTHRDEQYLYYLLNARMNKDQPLNLTADEYTSSNYGAIVYAKKALSVQMLRAYLGDEMFDKCMQTFFDEWKFKHPSRNDWQEVMERVSGKKLGWFYNRYYQTTARIDLKAKRLKRKDGQMEITVKNKGDVVAPFSLSTYNKEGKLNTYQFEPFLNKKTSFTIPESGAKWVTVDGDKNNVDHNRKNNSMRTKGVLKKMEPLQVRLLTSFENSDKTQLFVTPLLGWNTADEFMLGVGLHNKSFVEKRFEWFLGPMYSFHRNDITGIGDIKYNMYPKGFQRVSLWFNYMRFAYDIPIDGFMQYNRYYPKATFRFQPKRLRSNFRHGFQLGAIYLEEQYKGNSTPIINATNTFGKVKYFAGYRAGKHKVTGNLNAIINEEFNQLEYTFKYVNYYNRGGNQLSARLYLGQMLYNESNNPLYNLRMDGQTGYFDYQKNQVFPDRAGTRDVWRNQMNENHGAFKTPTAVGQSANWLAALNLKFEAPFRLPVGVYTDLGASDNADFVFNAGFSFRIWRDVCEVYFPVLWSQNILDYYETNDIDYGSRIRFTLNLPAADPYKQIQKLNL